MSRKRMFRVPGIRCGHCVATIERELGELEGVTAVDADAGTKIVSIEYDDMRTKWDSIHAVLKEIDYPPEE